MRRRARWATGDKKVVWPSITGLLQISATRASKAYRRRSPAAAQPWLFRFTPNRQRAAVRSNGSLGGVRRACVPAGVGERGGPSGRDVVRELRRGVHV